MRAKQNARVGNWMAGFLFACVLNAQGQQGADAPALAAPIPKGAVVLDHVVAVINGSIILQSDVQEEMSYAVLQPFSVDSARNTPQRALQRLIDRDLILQQMETAQTVAPPTPEELQQRITQLRGVIPECARYHCETDAGWQKFLEAKGLTEKEVEAHWRQRLLILSFIQSRFGSGVRITPAEIADYYNKSLIPQFHEKDKTLMPPPLATVSSRIEEILLQQRVSSLLLEWLQSLKSEGSVSILDPAYGRVGTTGSGDDSASGGQP
jgi:peptidyl-prolyl cis-trans isomerase SurA